MAGLIQGQCEVLHPTKFQEESERRSQSEFGYNRGLRPIFLCKYALALLHVYTCRFFSKGMEISVGYFGATFLALVVTFCICFGMFILLNNTITVFRTDDEAYNLNLNVITMSQTSNGLLSYIDPYDQLNSMNYCCGYMIHS